MSLCLAGLGTAVPEHFIAQTDAADLARNFQFCGDEQARVLNMLYRRSGVQRRHSVLLESSESIAESRQSFFPRSASPADRGPTTTDRMQRYEAASGPLAFAAAQRALAEADMAANALTHLITVSCSGFAAPGVDIALIRQLGLSPRIARTHIGFMGCHGALNGLRAALAFGQADSRARVILCAVELCSLHMQYGDESDKLVSNSLFADGAAAVIAVPDFSASRAPWKLAATGSVLIPDSEDAMSWRIRDFGFEMTLSPRVPELICRHLRGWLEEFLSEQDLKLADVGSWAVHPGGPRILTAVEEALSLPPQALACSRGVLAEFGNMSSPTLLFILDRLRREAAPRPCVALGFGPGLIAEAAVFR